jgi:hypothetical protein
MSATGLKKFVLAVAFSLPVAFAYQALAQGARGGGPISPPAGARAQRAPGLVLHGKSVARFGGYALNIVFTPDGKLLCFDLTTDGHATSRPN